MSALSAIRYVCRQYGISVLSAVRYECRQYGISLLSAVRYECRAVRYISSVGGTVYQFYQQ